MTVSDETDCNDVKIADLPRPAFPNPSFCRQSSELVLDSSLQIFCWDSDNTKLGISAMDKNHWSWPY